MKQFFSLLLAVGMFSSQQTQAQNLTAGPICITNLGDDFVFDSIVSTGNNTYHAEGSSNVYPGGSKAIMDIKLKDGETFGKIRITSINLKPDGCTHYTDSIIDIGDVFISKPAIPQGIWFKSYGTGYGYCDGKAIKPGEGWALYGPCSRVLKGAPKKMHRSEVAFYQQKEETNKKVTVAISPNPSSNFTQISYHLTTASKVNITVYNAMQQPVKVLVNENKAAGNYKIYWNLINASNVKVPTGVYRVVTSINGQLFSSALQVIN